PRSARRARRSSRRAASALRPARAGTPRRRSCRLGEHRARDPVDLRARELAERDPLGRRGPVPRDDRLELLPVGLGVGPDAVLAALELRIRQREAELPDLGDIPLEELLARLLV